MRPPSSRGIVADMASLPHRDRIVDALRRTTTPLDDDQLSERTEIRPRQAVNRICRELRDTGLVRRYDGPDGKVVNELVRGAHPEPGGPADAVPQVVQPTSEEPVVLRGTGHDRPPGSSHEQRDAERVMLDLLGKQLGKALEPATLHLPGGVRVELDGADVDRTVLVECWAHQGPPKAAQRHKVLADAFKLTWIFGTIYPRPRLVLCLSDPEAAAPFVAGSRSWAARALQDLGFSVSVVELPDDMRRRVVAAQQRQYR